MQWRHTASSGALLISSPKYKLFPLLIRTKAAALFARLMDTAVQPIVSLAGVTLSTRSVPKVGVALVIHKPKEKVTPEGKSELAVRPVTEKASGEP